MGARGDGVPGWERELSNPSFRPPSFYTTMTPEFATREYGFPVGVAGVKHLPHDDSVWIFDNLSAGEWDLVAYPPTGDPYLAVKARER